MKLKLNSIKKEANNIYSFLFEPSQKINYLPGQYIYLTIPWLKNDYRGFTRHFTLSSSPTEKYIQVTTRVRENSEFKIQLTKLKKGDEIEANGPTGTFILDEKEPGNHFLIAGGIGVTPFRSAIKYCVDKSILNLNIHLLYSVKDLDEGAFIEELNKYSQNNENIKIDITLTQNYPGDWNGFKGRIDEKMINKLVKDREINKYWLCGPPNMISAMEEILIGMNIKSDKIISEKFTGY